MLEKNFIRSVKVDRGKLREEDYTTQLPVIKQLMKKELSFIKPVTFFVGENGTGKSTLLEAIAVQCGFNAEGGTKNIRFATSETHSTLYQSMKVVRSIPFPSDGFFLRAESFYNVATEIDRLDKISLCGESLSHNFLKANYGGKSLHEQSHGESFLALALNRFHGKSIFFLDEPEAALSPSRQMTLLARIHDLVNEDCQFIIATHSPILMAYPNAEIVVLTEQGAQVTPYKETEHYQITRQFLENPERMLKYLLGD